MNREIWTPPKLVNWIKSELKRRNLGGNHRFEAELLVAKGLEMKRLDLYLQFDRPLNATELGQIRNLLRRRLNREPLAYILGDAHFWTLVLQVGPGVLIPRSDTEILVEFLIDYTSGTKTVRALEFGVGSGAISLAWACESKQLQIDGLEISTEALKWAQLNLAHYQTEIEENQSQVNWLINQPLSSCSGPYDVLVSNPPYVTSSEMEQLEPEVRTFEPALALCGGDDGLQFYRLLFLEGLRLIVPKGILVIEHGASQKTAILEIMPAGFQLLQAKQDLNHHDRMLVFERNSAPSL